MINIVTPEWTSNRILARLTRHLLVVNGWEVSKEPRADATLNLFMPYLEWRKTKWDKTPTAAWFTHYEPDDKVRKKAWEECAEAMTVRVTPAYQYAAALSRYGLTSHLPHPVELHMFSPRSKSSNDPIVGLSGFLYPGGRKGEAMVSRLVQDHPEWSIRASGEGWPCETKLYTWKNLPTFYQGLGCFVCTSLIEGGPVTVLEALACGVPVVIPRGVGECDEIPSIPGVYHYAMGNYEALEEGIHKALENPGDPKELRALVEERTIARYAAGWQDAIAPVLLPKTADRGLYVVAFGEPAKDCARALIASNRAQDDYQVAVVSDELIEGADARIIVRDHSWGGRDEKLQVYDLAPQAWRYVIYCDADTIVHGSLEYIFQLLESGWDMVMTASPDANRLVWHSGRDDRVAEFEATIEELGCKSLLQPAGGVWAFARTPAARRFLQEWRKEWMKYGKNDQLAMARAFYRCSMKVAWLGEGWNCFMHHEEAESRVCGFAHFATAAREWGDPKHPGRQMWAKWISERSTSEPDGAQSKGQSITTSISTATISTSAGT